MHIKPHKCQTKLIAPRNFSYWRQHCARGLSVSSRDFARSSATPGDRANRSPRLRWGEPTEISDRYRGDSPHKYTTFQPRQTGGKVQGSLIGLFITILRSHHATKHVQFSVQCNRAVCKGSLFAAGSPDKDHFRGSERLTISR